MAHGSGTADVNLSTDGNFPSTIVDAYIKKKILAHGVSTYRFRAAANKDQQPAGDGTNIKFIRYNRLVLPTELTEGVPPDADALAVETVTGQCKQFGQVVEISDVLELTMWHPVVKKALEELAESAARKDDAIIQNVIIAGSNVEFGDTAGTAATDRADVTALDVLTTRTLRRVISNLDMGGVVGTQQNADGGAKPKEDGLYLGIINRRSMLDLMDDTVWAQMAERQDKKALEGAEIYKWSKCKFTVTNFSHELTNDGDALVGEGFGGAGTLPNGDYRYAWTRVNNKRGLEEIISDDNLVIVANSGTNTLNFRFTTDANHTYNLYIGEAEGDFVDAPALKLHTEGIVGTGLAAAEAQIVTSTLGTGRVCPATPGGATVFVNYIFGTDAFSVVDLSSLKTLVSKGAQKSDPLDQLRTMGTKFFMTALILNNAFMVRLECGSQY